MCSPTPFHGGADLDDVDVSLGDVGFNLELVPEVIRHSGASPDLDPVRVGLGERHRVRVRFPA